MPYYEKFGFEYVKEAHLQRGEKPISLPIMVREPQASAGPAPAEASSKEARCVQRKRVPSA